MSPSKWMNNAHRVPHATRFFVAIVAGGGMMAACQDASKPVESSARAPGGLASGPAASGPTASGPTASGPTASGRAIVSPVPAHTALLEHDYPFVVKSSGKDTARGTIRARIDGPVVPHAAYIATGPHFRARTRACFINASREGVAVRGSVQVTLVVDATGTVTQATASGTANATLRSCIAAGAKKLGFNPVEGGGSSKVVVDLHFPGEG